MAFAAGWRVGGLGARSPSASMHAAVGSVNTLSLTWVLPWHGDADGAG